MKTVNVEKWEEVVNDGSPSGKSVEVDSIKLLTMLINSQDPQNAPKGLDQFRLMNRISKAFDKAQKSGKIELEEGDYAFLKKLIENNIPANLGMNTGASNAVEGFLEAKAKA